MLDAPGVGLAAPQIGVGLRVFTYDVDDVVGHLINPVLRPVPTTRSRTATRAACRFPGLAFAVRARSMHVDRQGLQRVRRPGHHRGQRAAGPVRPARDRPPRRRAVHRPARPRAAQGGDARRSARPSGRASPVPAVKVSAAPSTFGRARCSDARWSSPAPRPSPSRRLTRLLASPHDVVAVDDPARTPPPAAAGELPPARSRALAPRRPASRCSRRGARASRSSATGCASSRPTACPVVAYGALVPPRRSKFPAHGWINLHFSLLPAWRGAAPVQHAILHGDEITGATTFQLEEGLDTGPVLRRRHRGDPPARHRRRPAGAARDAGAGLLVATLDGIAARRAAGRAAAGRRASASRRS